MFRTCGTELSSAAQSVQWGPGPSFGCLVPSWGWVTGLELSEPLANGELSCLLCIDFGADCLPSICLSFSFLLCSAWRQTRVL